MAGQTSTSSRINNHEQSFYEFMAAFSVPSADANRVDLLLGRHPLERRWLSEDEGLDRVWPYIRWMDRADRDQVPAISPWLTLFPEINEPGFAYETEVPSLWSTAFRAVSVHATIYGFRPSGAFGDRSFEEDARRLANDAAGRWGGRICEGGRTLFAAPFASSGVAARMLESAGGLEAAIRRRLSLSQDESGFILRYLRRRGHELHDLLSWRQFEEVVVLIFREDGWDVTLTPKTRDGGKDVVARKDIDGVPVVAYVEAKNYDPRRPVRLPEVKEFVATLGGDGVDRGFMLTTSYVSRDAQEWAATKGQRIAAVEFLDRARIHDKIAQLVDGVPRSYRFTGDFG